MHHWIRSALVQIMACRLFGAKPLSEPVLGYCWLDPSEQTSVKFLSKCKTFNTRKCIWKYRLRKGGHFVLGKMSEIPLTFGNSVYWIKEDHAVTADALVHEVAMASSDRISVVQKWWYFIKWMSAQALISCAHTLQGYFTVTGAICPSDGEVTLKGMNWWIT